MTRIVLLILLVIWSSLANAGGRGGYNTTFDPNWYGGAANVKCLTAAIAGICTVGYNATCNGSGTNDASAWAAYRTAAIAANPAKAVLYVPPGSDCRGGNVAYLQGIANPIVWAYGATFDYVTMGTLGSPIPTVDGFNALIQTANAGDTTVTLITAAESSIFAVGDWVVVNALSLQAASGPPNWNFFEYKVITAITGTSTKVITLSSPLTYSYSSTYPAWTGNNADGGPANLTKVRTDNVLAYWDTRVEWHGGTIGGVGECLVISGRTIIAYDVTWLRDTCPSASDAIWFFNSYVSTNRGTGVEIDKVINLLYFFRSSSNQLFVQSSSVNLMVIDSSTSSVFPEASFGLNGTPTNLRIINSVIPGPFGMQLNPVSYGHGVSIEVDGSFIGAASRSTRAVPNSWFSFSGGVLTIANSDPNLFHVFEWAVPGQKYYSSQSEGTPCASSVAFMITSLIQDGTNTKVGTDLGSVPSCGVPTLYYAPYTAGVITQRNSRSGSVDITGYAAPQFATEDADWFWLIGDNDNANWRQAM